MGNLSNRQILMGTLEAEKKIAHDLKIEIDSLVSSIVYQFEPRDAANAYIDTIDGDKLQVYVASMRKKLGKLKEAQAEISRLKRELNGDEA